MTETPVKSEFRVDLLNNTIPVILNCEIGGEAFLWQQSGCSEIYESELRDEGGWTSSGSSDDDGSGNGDNGYENSVNSVIRSGKTLLLKEGECILLKRRNLINSTPILVSQLKSGGVVLCLTNSTMIE